MIHSNAPRAVLWDLDGTLVDTRELHWLAWRAVMAENGHALDRTFFLDTFGQRNDLILSALLRNPTATEIARISESKEERYREMLLEQGSELLPGAEAWMRRLKDAGWRQALASSAPRRNAETVLNVLGIGWAFDAVICGEDVRHGKPDPEVYLLAAAGAGVRSLGCIVVEDSPYGVEGARRAGMRYIAVADPNATEPIFGGDHWVTSTLDLLPPTAFDALLGTEQ